MFFAELNTARNEFRTLAASVEQALINLRAMWNMHTENSACEMPTWEMLEDSVRITPVMLNDTWTDCAVCMNCAHAR